MEMMTKRATLAVVCAAALSFGSAHGQGLVPGAEQGASRGEDPAVPIGAVVVGAIGAAVGTANGMLGVDRRERFRVYAFGERRPSFAYGRLVRVGSILPEDGIVYYDVPREFALPGYNCTVVNDRPVPVEPRTRRVVEVID